MKGEGVMRRPRFAPVQPGPTIGSPNVRTKLVPMRRLAAALAAGMILLGLVASAGPAHAVVPGTNGRILFTRSICTSDTRPCWEIVAADPNDTHETVLAGPIRGAPGTTTSPPTGLRTARA
jgi:hypothetical protein